MEAVNSLEVDISSERELKAILTMAGIVDAKCEGFAKAKCSVCGKKHNIDKWLYGILRSIFDDYVCTECKKDG